MKKFIKIIPIFFVLFLVNANPIFAYVGSNDIQINLGVNGCNNDGICEPGETALNCPVDCAPVTPPPSGGGGGIVVPPQSISIYNLSVEPDFTSAIISWNTSVSTTSTIKWGETTDVTEGTLTSVVFARDHKMEIINLKPGTMYFFTIESQDVNGVNNTNQPTYFFTKFLINTAFPLAPLDVKAFSDITGITITWQNPPDENFSYVRIMRYDDRFRGDPFSGDLVYEGKDEKFLDKNVTAGKEYFYVLFSKDNTGNFSNGVGVSAIAYSPKQILPPPLVVPPKIAISQTFFAYQYNQQVTPLLNAKAIMIDGSESTIVDTNIQTLPDDWMKVINSDGEIVGQYLFSFNVDSGRYQSVIPPLQKKGNYNIEIYRYENNIPTIISEGSLYVAQNTTPKVEEPYGNIYADYYLYIAIFLIILVLLILFLRRRQKSQ